jgi:hypothetical protein
MDLADLRNAGYKSACDGQRGPSGSSSRSALRAVITLPVAVHTDRFRWQLDLFWFAHRHIYGRDAHARAHAIVIKRNDVRDSKAERMSWNIDVPHTMCEAFFDLDGVGRGRSLPSSKFDMAVPLNIQTGLMQVLPIFADEQVLEVIDCDMFHFRPCLSRDVAPNELLVSDVYENWHLFSLTKNRDIISPYFANGGRYYNGGFVPIIGRTATFKRILPEWSAVHIDILRRNYNGLIHWWAGMFALQAACEKTRVQMVGCDYCYVPDANTLTPTQYIGHYSVDQAFNKRAFPRVDINKLPNNPYYRMIVDWVRHRKYRK